MDKNIAKKLHKDRNEILNFCNKHNRIYIYGAGTCAPLIIRYLLEEDIEIKGIIISEKKEDSPESLCGIKVYEINEINLDETCGIFIAVGIALQLEIFDFLLEYGLQKSQIYRQRLYRQYMDSYEKIHSSNWSESKEGYFSIYTDLNMIGVLKGTDKSSRDHNYLNKYEFFLAKWKNKEIVLLELGVLNGASIDMWSEYFVNGKIYGVDIDKRCLEYAGGNKEIIIQDLGWEESLEKLGEKLLPDILIDDASHYWSDQIKAIWHLLPKMKNGGVFIMEDLNTSHIKQCSNGFDDTYASAYEFCEALALAVNSGTYLEDINLKNSLVCLRDEIVMLASMIEMVAFIHDSCIIVKK